MKSILKFAMLFLLGSLVLSFFGSFLTVAFTSMGSTISVMTQTTGVGLVLSSIWEFLAWAVDLIFINTDFVYSNALMSDSIQIGSISWALSFFRMIFGATLIVFIISLIFGGKNA